MPVTPSAGSNTPQPLPFATVRWEGGIPGRVVILEQTRLPLETVEIGLSRVEEMFDAIHRLAVRGAPAIGVAGGYGLVLGIQKFTHTPAASPDLLRLEVDRVAAYLKSARPTAVNLAWAVDRVATVAREELARGSSAGVVVARAFGEARTIDESDRRCCDAIGQYGADLLNIQNGAFVYTHCNAGALATAGIGTALGVYYAAAARGVRFTVFADETRPLLQGARLTAYELQRAGIDVRVVCDGMAAHVMETYKISAVVVGADRIAANGDAANKIGTCTLAIVAKHYGVPFYVAAPRSTFDLSLPDGSGIPIEERKGEEITKWGDVQTAPEGVGTFNPAFDVTPARLITAIITDAGVAMPPSRETIANLFRSE